MKKLLTLLLITISMYSFAPNITMQQEHENISLYFCKEREQFYLNRADEIRTMDITLELLKEYVNILYPNSSDVILKQFILETGWFTSNYFVYDNNMCGMEPPKTRETTALGKREGRRYAYYSHWTSSVDDYMLWLQYHLERKKDTSNYYQFLVDVNYAESPKYISLLKSINVSWYD